MGIKTWSVAGIGVLIASAGICGAVLNMSSGAPRTEVADPGTATKALTAAERKLLYRAEQELIGKCLTKQGFKYFPDPPPWEPLPEAERAFRYTIDDVAWAKKYGYGSPPDLQKAKEGPESTYFRSLSTADQEALRAAHYGDGRQIEVAVRGIGTFSVSDNGCQAHVTRVLYGDLTRWYEARIVADNLPLVVNAKVRRDPGLAEAMVDWAECMQGKGYGIDDTGELQEQLDDRTRGMRPDAARRIRTRAAVEEARCTHASVLASTIDHLEAQYRDHLNQAYRRQVLAVVRLERAALPTAKSIVAAADHPQMRGKEDK